MPTAGSILGSNEDARWLAAAAFVARYGINAHHTCQYFLRKCCSTEQLWYMVMFNRYATPACISTSPALKDVSLSSQQCVNVTQISLHMIQQ